MISKKNRFHGLGSVRPLYRRGQSARSPHMGLKYAPNRRRETYRAAVVVSKKVSKSAVVRNRIRRRVYEALRAQQDRITEPYDIVFTVYSDKLADMPADELTKTVDSLLKQAKII